MREVSCLLVRHGKTQGNIEKRYIGCKTDEDLCAIGIEELSKCNLAKSDISLSDKVYVSPLLRCRHTASIIFPYQGMIEVEDLKEIDFGDFENMNYKELEGNEDYQHWIDSGGTIPFPGGEAREAFIERNINAFRDILLKEGRDKTEEKSFLEAESCTIPFVIHGGSIMAIMSELTREDYYKFQISCGDAYIVKCLINEEKIDVISYNCISGRSDS